MYQAPTRQYQAQSRDGVRQNPAQDLRDELFRQHCCCSCSAMASALYASALPGVTVSQSSFSLPRHSQLANAALRCGIRRTSDRAARVIAAASDDRDDGNLTGEWPVNWSLASYEVRCGVLSQSTLDHAGCLPLSRFWREHTQAVSDPLLTALLSPRACPMSEFPARPMESARTQSRCCAQDVGQYFQDNVFKDSAAPGVGPLRS